MPKTAIRVVDRAQMLAIETQTFHEFDTNEEIIIENVGLEAALYLQSKYKLQSDERVAIYCGKGNNAADGMALARHLHGMGLMIDLYLMFPMKDFSSQAQIQLKRLQCVQHSNLRIHECSIESRPEFNLPLRLLIDCIFGTGLNQVLGEKWQTFFRFIEKNCQRLDAPIVSIDLPSGALPDQATVDKSVLHCQLTLMVGAVKVGPMFSEAISALGELHVLRAGFPRQLTHSNVEHQLVASNNSEQQFTAPVEWHKYQKGHVLIIGGNKGMSGAAILSAIAAQRSGAGLITLGHPDGSGDEVAQRLPSDMMLLALDKNSANSLNSSLSKITSILIGPGLGRDQFSEDLWSSLLAALLLQTKKISVVVDADGLYHLANGLKNKLELPKNVNWILTPHLGELKQLLVQLPPQWTKDWELSPLGCIEKLAQHLGVHIVLKNAGATAIVSPLKKMKFHYAPCAALATAGSGDILAGMICAQLSLRREEFVSNNQLMIEILSACVFLHNQLGQSILGQGQGALAILEKLEKSTFSEQK